MTLVKAVGIALTLVVIAASAWMNFEYMSEEGSGRASVILGVISVAFDLIKSMLPIVIAAALVANARWQALVAAIFLIAFMAFGFVSALGFGEGSKGERVTSREGLAAELRDREIDLEAARQRLRASPDTRPVGAINADIAALKKDRSWDSSKGCTDATSSVSRELCKTIDRLTGEVAVAAERELLALKIERLTGEAQSLRDRGAGRDADPQASAIRRIIGQLFPGADNNVIRSSVAWLFAGLVEGWSAFGLYLCGVRHTRISATPSADLRFAGTAPAADGAEPADNQAEIPETTSNGTMLRTAIWAKERLDFDDDSCLGIEAAFADYQQVAAQAGKGCLPFREFRLSLIITAVVLDCEVWGQELRGIRLAAVIAAAPALGEGSDAVINGMVATLAMEQADVAAQ